MSDDEEMVSIDMEYEFYKNMICENMTIDEKLEMDEQKMANIFECNGILHPKVKERLNRIMNCINEMLFNVL